MKKKKTAKTRKLRYKKVLAIELPDGTKEQIREFGRKYSPPISMSKVAILALERLLRTGAMQTAPVRGRPPTVYRKTAR